MGCKNFFRKSQFHSVVDRMSRKREDLGGVGKKEKRIRNTLKEVGQD